MFLKQNICFIILLIYFSDVIIKPYYLSNKIIFLKYISSPIEDEWINDLRNNNICSKTQYCSIWNKYNDRLTKLNISIHKCKYNNICENEDLSYFIFEKNGKKILEYIEPLFGILRNTFSLCTDGYDIVSKDYILPSKIVKEKKIIFLDAGASLFYHGQNFFYNYYKNIIHSKFYKWYLWEIKKYNKSEIYNIPDDLIKIYNYYNRPINSVKQSTDNPLFYIEKYKSNYSIVFKLDVDNPSVELPIFNVMLSDINFCPHEFYFEYHFNTLLMYKWWKNKVDHSCSLSCATQKFLQLRKKGVIAHAWI